MGKHRPLGPGRWCRWCRTTRRARLVAVPQGRCRRQSAMRHRACWAVPAHPHRRYPAIRSGLRPPAKGPPRAGWSPNKDGRRNSSRMYLNSAGCSLAFMGTAARPACQAASRTSTKAGLLLMAMATRSPARRFHLPVMPRCQGGTAFVPDRHRTRRGGCQWPEPGCSVPPQRCGASGWRRTWCYSVAGQEAGRELSDPA